MTKTDEENSCDCFIKALRLSEDAHYPSCIRISKLEFKIKELEEEIKQLKLSCFDDWI